MTLSAHSPRYDWQAIELDYKAGVLSLAEICRKHGCSLSRLSSIANKHGWARSELPDFATVHGLASSGFPPTGVGWLDDDTIKKAALVTQASVVESHRDDIARLRNMAVLLADRLGLHLTGADITFPLMGKSDTPVNVLHKLTVVQAQIIQLERQSYGLGVMAAPAEAGSEYKEALDEIEGRLETLTRAKAKA